MPEEFELLGLFETEPITLDASEVPFFYNKSTYKYINSETEEFTFSLLPSFDEIDFKVSKYNTEIANLKLYHIKSFDILSDTKIEKRIMLTSENYLIKIQLKPRFSIELTENMNDD